MRNIAAIIATEWYVAAMKISALKVAALGAFALVACHQEEPAPHKKPKVEAPPAPAGVQIDSAKLALFAPLPDAMEAKTNPLTEDKTSLGRTLYFDPRLSKNHDISCNSCHDLEKYGVDGKDVSDGHRAQKGSRNSPTVYNAAAQFVQFWDGRAETVEDQAKGPMLNPLEMAMPSDSRVVDTLKSMPGYVDAFKKAFPDDAEPVTFDNLAKAIGAFERKLVTRSKWDNFLKGDKTALSDDEKKGFNKFVDVGCATCHMGALVGGTMYQKLGNVKPWPNQKDKGRGQVTKSPSDDMMFKVSQLRNVQHTAPYFHDASAKTLEEAVKMMATYQLGKELPDEDVKSIVTWLDTLSGLIPTDYVKKPTLPASTPKTPKPDPK
jgi:cytochrome c peroxidase